MKKIIILLIALLFVSGCSYKDSRGLYKILKYNGTTIYSEEENPKMMSNGSVVSIKKFLPKSNCVLSCIYDYTEAIEILDNGIKIYSYEVEDTKYYYVDCNNNVAIIGDSYEKLVNYC